MIHGNVANLVGTGFTNAQNVPTGALVWGPNYGLGAPGNPHQRLGVGRRTAPMPRPDSLRQWGTATLRLRAPRHAVSFPLQFPGQCFNVVFSLSSGGHAPSAYVSRLSASGFVAGLQGVTDGATLYWQALGV